MGMERPEEYYGRHRGKPAKSAEISVALSESLDLQFVFSRSSGMTTAEGRGLQIHINYGPENSRDVANIFASSPEFQYVTRKAGLSAGDFRILRAYQFSDTIGICSRRRSSRVS